MDMQNLWNNLIKTSWFNYTIFFIVIDIIAISLFFYDVTFAELYIFGFPIFAPIYIFLKIFLVLSAFFIDTKIIKKEIKSHFILQNKYYTIFALSSVLFQILILLLIFAGMLICISSWGIEGTIENYKNFFSAW